MPARIVNVDPSQPFGSAVEELRKSTRSLIVVLGAFDPALNDRVRAIFDRVVVPVGAGAEALVVDDAALAGCAPLAARAILEQRRVPKLLGIVSSDRTDAEVEPNHELVLRLPPEWSGQARYLLELAEEALGQKDAGKPRVAVLLFGGGGREKQALTWCARNRWPVLVFGKTGGLADEIIAALADSARAANDPGLKEIIETAVIASSPVDADADEFTRILMRLVAFSPENFIDTLKEVWARYDEIDQNAVARQNRFRWLQLVLVSLAVLAALLAILTAVRLPAGLLDFMHRWYVPPGTLHISVILTPIAISILAAYNSHFRDGNKWILLRGAAEALKREVFRYRAQACAYSDEQCIQTSRESRLAAKAGEIMSSLVKSEVNKTALRDVVPGREDRYTPLSPDDYVQARIQDQIRYFRKTTRRLGARVTALELMILIAGGTGTFLAAIHQDIWVALATAVVTAVTTKMQSDQLETSLVQYNQARASLETIESWWKALSPWERSRRRNIDLLVDQTEKTLESETAGWIQQMQSALDKLTEKETQQDGRKS